MMLRSLALTKFSIKSLLRNQDGVVRTFLSEAYSCNEAWQRRFDCPILKKVKMNVYFIEVDKKFQTKRLASGVDIDIFANCVRQEHEIEELEHLLYKFRRSKRACEIQDSTHYAVVRALLDSGDYESLLRILRDRQNYGIFPDFYCYNMLMDTFLKEQRYRDAAEIAILMMHQEIFSNRISRYLGLYSCHKFLKQDPTLESWKLEQDDDETKLQQNADDDEDEVEYVRVPFLRNPWFDDHFDIVNPNHLIGKTFYLIGREEKNILGHSYQLVGLGMYNKWEKAMNLIKEKLEPDSSPKFLTSAVGKFQESLHALPDDVEEKKNLISEFENHFKTMEKNGKLIAGNHEEELELTMKNIPELESIDIEEQNALFPKWQENRMKLTKQQEWDIEKERRLKIIEEKKEELFWKEKYLFFFENEESILEELQEVEKIIESQKTKVSEEEAYVPPEIVKRRPTKLSLLRKKAMVKSLQ